MELAKKLSEKEHYAEILEFFTQEDVQNNLTFLILIGAMLENGLAPKDNIIKLIDPTDESNVLYFTNDKFLEVMDMYGLDGFIY